MIETVVDASGKVIRLRNGKPHCTTGPAVVSPNGDYAWYVDGKLHNTEGPAAQYGDMVVWCIRGQYMTREQWERSAPQHRAVVAAE